MNARALALDVASWGLRIIRTPLLAFFPAQQVVHGMELTAVRGDLVDAHVSRIRSALELILERDPARFDRLRRDVPRIWLWTNPKQYRGVYGEPLQVCLLDSVWLMRVETTIVEVAMVLVHEAMHARLHRAGVKRWRHGYLRIERACVREEIRFARRCPDASEEIRRTEGMYREAERHWTR